MSCANDGCGTYSPCPQCQGASTNLAPKGTYCPCPPPDLGRPLTPAQLANSLVVRLGPAIDNVRQIATNLGARSRRVFLVWTQWTNDDRGDGREIECARIEILPTPLVESLDAVAFNGFAAGVLPEGTIRVSQISASFSESQLRGLYNPLVANLQEIVQPFDTDTLLVPAGTSLPLDHIPPTVSFFYEVVEDVRHEPLPIRQKYRLSAQPRLDETNVQWKIVLERISEDARRDGLSRYGEGD